MCRISGILETSLYCVNVAQSAEFYRRLFGFRPLLESDRLVALDVAGKNVLLLFQAGATQEPAETTGGEIPPHGATGPIHVAFSIASDDLAPWEQKLTAAGVAIESTVNWPSGAQSLYFRDPDGHLVELLTPGFWSIH
jgi:catechol 2,3-dioxygenase-like lactoylglutathione lyase family enzyme